jgi:outer membrane cobalamin receptor
MRVLLVLLLLPATALAQASRPDTARLPTATIRDTASRLPEAYLRRSAFKGKGKFLTSKDIEKLNPPHTPNLLARISGGDIRDIGGGNTAIVGSRGTRMTTLGSTQNQLCVISMALNDTRVPNGFDLKAIRPEDIAAIEFYSGPSSIPLELTAVSLNDPDCGLFVIWTKDRRRPR